MAKRIGTCVNLDCDNYKKEVEVEAGADFECPLCHQPLKEKVGGGKKPDNKGGKGGLIAGIAALVVCAGGAGAYFMMGDDEAKQPVEVEKTQPIVTPEPTDTAEAKPVQEPVKEEPAKETPAPKVVNGRGTVDLGYATYVGDLKNGKPHGYGTLTYKKSQKIVPSKDYVASPGDTFEGEFRDGRISGLGYWKHDGNQTVVKP